VKAFFLKRETDVVCSSKTISGIWGNGRGKRRGGTFVCVGTLPPEGSKIKERRRGKRETNDVLRGSRTGNSGAICGWKGGDKRKGRFAVQNQAEIMQEGESQDQRNRCNRTSYGGESLKNANSYRSRRANPGLKLEY